MRSIYYVFRVNRSDRSAAKVGLQAAVSVAASDISLTKINRRALGRATGIHLQVQKVD